MPASCALLLNSSSIVATMYLVCQLHFFLSKRLRFVCLLVFTKLETAEFSPFLATVIFIGNYTSRELIVQFVTHKM